MVQQLRPHASHCWGHQFDPQSGKQDSERLVIQTKKKKISTAIPASSGEHITHDSSLEDIPFYDPLQLTYVSDKASLP